MASEIIKNQQGRYDIVGVADEFEKNGAKLSGMAGHGEIAGWLRSQLGFAISVKENDETLYFNTASASKWLDRHHDLFDDPTKVPSIVKKIQTCLKPVLNLKIRQNDQGSYDFGTMKNITGYGDIFGLIFFYLGWVFAVLDETGSRFYLDRKSTIQAVNQQGQLLDDQAESSVIINTIQDIFDKSQKASPPISHSEPVEASPISHPEPLEKTPISHPEPVEKRKLRRANAVIWRKGVSSHVEDQLVKKRSASDPIKRIEDRFIEEKRSRGLASYQLEGLNLAAHAISVWNLLKLLNEQFQATEHADSLGLTEEEIEKINAFVAQKEDKWNKPDFKRRRYYLGEGKYQLPRTIDVFKENGQLFVMILCKRKEGWRH